MRVMVIAFPGGSGTADMVRRSKLAGVKTIEVASDGSLTETTFAK